MGGSLLGASLPEMLAAKAFANQSSDYIRGKSIVLLFLSGGPSHIEFFDPKMTAPSEIHSVTGETTTKTPGVTIGGTFEKLAKLSDKFSIVRSFGSGNSGHTYEKVASGNNPLKAAMSAIYARVAGGVNSKNGVPNNVLLKPEALQDGLKLGSNFETSALPSLTEPGSLGKNYAAFDPSGGGELQEALSLKLTLPRLGERRQLLNSLDSMRRAADTNSHFHLAEQHQQQAFEMITRGIADAFDISKEDAPTLARYDTSHLFRDSELQRFGDMRRVTNLLGKQLLLARRLCEAGCGFVTVSDCGWDMHANNNSPKGMAGMWPMSRQVDHAVAAFIEDLHERGLENDILLVVTGEMGRNPRLNKGGGRDHYGELTPLLFAGGGLKMGQVIGQSDATASKAATTPYRPPEMMATIMHTLFDIGKLRLDSSLPRELEQAITSVKPIAGLV